MDDIALSTVSGRVFVAPDASIDPPKPHQSQRRQQVEKNKMFACPFGIHDPIKYKDCFRLCLRGVQQVKQHILRTEHLRHFATPQHLKQFKQRQKGNTSEARWFAVWDVSFDGKNRPRSPYVATQLSADLRSYTFFLRIQGKGRLAAALHKHFPGIQRKYLDQAMDCEFSDTLDLVANDWAVEHKAMHTEEVGTKNSISLQLHPPTVTSSAATAASNMMAFMKSEGTKCELAHSPAMKQATGVGRVDTSNVAQAEFASEPKPLLLPPHVSPSDSLVVEGISTASPAFGTVDPYLLPHIPLSNQNLLF